MENVEKRLNDMQQQLQQMKEKLEQETIINDRLLRKAYRKTLSNLHKKALGDLIIAIVGMLCWLPMITYGISVTFIVATEIMLAFSLIGQFMINRKLPNMNTDLITAAKGVAHFRKVYSKWFWWGIPILILWAIGLYYELTHNPAIGIDRAKTFLVGGAFGGILGLVIGLIKRRKVLNKADETLEQIKNLTKDNE